MDETSSISTTTLELNNTLEYLNWDNSSFKNNATLPDRSLVVKSVIDYLILVNSIMILLSMGCEITKEQLLHNVKRPIGISIGMFSQFVIMPLSGFSMAKIMAVDDLTAAGILLISCCPGGLISNVITYYCDGDVSLSVAMTSLSTFMAMGLMPLNLWIYGRNFETGGFNIPYVKLAIALLMVTSPVMVGMVIRWKSPRTARLISKVFSVICMVIIIVCVIMIVTWFPSIFIGGQTSVYVAVLTLPFLGFGLGYFSAVVFRQTRKVCKTIAIESGFQNGAIAMAVIALSFPLEQQLDLLRVPLLYGMATLAGCTLICIVYQVQKKCANCEEEKFVPLTTNGNNGE